MISERSHIFAAVAGALLGFAALNLFAMSRNFWGFEYPLDDVYIHLAMAEGIVRGGYGVNTGEYASAASSPLYPLLLTPFAGGEVQRWLPLIWNTLFLITAAVLFGKLISRAAPNVLGVVASAIGLVALASITTAFTGMENMGHGAASLMIVLGLWRFVETGRLNALLVFGVFLAPAFRLEGLALSLAAGGVVFVLDQRVKGAALMVLAVLPVAAFVLYLNALGIGPLPNSVIAKLGEGQSGLGSLIGKFQSNVAAPGGRLLFLVAVGLAVIALVARPLSREKAMFALAICAAAFAHLFAGSIGWMDRYENYILIASVAALALMLGQFAMRWAAPFALLVSVIGFFTYGPSVYFAYGWNMRAISDQHGEMARFAKEFAQAPVAVNDLGYVSWQNDHYVLDLWGLASKTALETRRSNPDPGWAGPLAEANDVGFAMIYDRWIGEALPDSWLKLGELQTGIPRAFLGGFEVSFYAKDSNEAERLIPLLQDWSTELPPGKRFQFEEAFE